MKNYIPPTVIELGDVADLTGFTGGGAFADYIILTTGEERGGFSETPSDFSCQNPRQNPYCD